MRRGCRPSRFNVSPMWAVVEVGFARPVSDGAPGPELPTSTVHRAMRGRGPWPMPAA